jgi:hypothetical protein
LRHIGLQNEGVKIGRHELSDDEWLLLGIVRTELIKIAAETAKKEKR